MAPAGPQPAMQQVTLDVAPEGSSSERFAIYPPPFHRKLNSTVTRWG